MKTKGFTPIFDGIVKELGSTEALVFGSIWRFCQMKGGCCATHKTIGDRIGLSHDTVSRAASRLVQAGYLKADLSMGGTYFYTDTGKADFVIQAVPQEDIYDPTQIALPPPQIALTPTQIALTPTQNAETPYANCVTKKQLKIQVNKEVEELTPAYTFSNDRIFCEVTGMVSVPGSEREKVLPALDALRTKYPNQNDLINYLKRYYTDWVKRRGKTGMNYSKTNCAWLYDLAVAEETLASEKREAVKAANREILEMGKPDPECKICGGNGVYNKDGRFIKCSCTKKERK